MDIACLLCAIIVYRRDDCRDDSGGRGRMLNAFVRFLWRKSWRALMVLSDGTRDELISIRRCWRRLEKKEIPRIPFRRQSRWRNWSLLSL
jgi:hypothetical protein